MHLSLHNRMRAAPPEVLVERELQSLLCEARHLRIRIRGFILLAVAGNLATAMRMLAPMGGHRAREAGAWLGVLALTGLSLVLGRRDERRIMAVHARVAELIRRG